MNPFTKDNLVEQTNKFRGKYRVESTRLKDWDYSSEGAYFITICTRNRECSLGDIVDGKITQTEQSRICMACWLDLSNHYPNCALDVFVIMPNHVHGIIFIEQAGGHDNGAGAVETIPVETIPVETIPVETIHELSLPLPLQNKRMQRRNMMIPKIIGRFKMRTAKLINQYQKTEGIPFWQKNYYDHIVRNESELARIREYVANNPMKWDSDRNNSENLYM